MEDHMIGSAPFFSALTEPDQVRISERMHLEHRSRGEVLFRKGDESSALYLIQSGWVRLLADGGTIIANQGPGSLVGDADLFLDRPRTIGALVASGAELWTLTRHDLADLVAQYPQIGIELSVAFGARLAALDSYVVQRRLRDIPFLAGLTDEALGFLAHRLQLVQKSAHEFIVERGQPRQGLFIVESGRVAVDGSEIGPGATFGEMAVLTARPHAQSAQALTDAVLWTLPTDEFEALSAERPEVRLALSNCLREPLVGEDRARACTRLSKMPLFAGLSQEVLGAVAERMWLRHVVAGELVFSAGVPADALYLIDSGQIDIVPSAKPQSTVLAHLGPDQFFGEMALLTGKPRSSAARATTHTNLWVLYRSDFDDLISRYPTISLGLSRVLSERLAEMDRRYSESHLRGVKLLADLSASQLEDISRRLKQVHFRQGEIILREGEPGDEMYLVESGRVRVVRGSGRDAVTLAELGAGDVFGEMALLTGNPRSASVTALSDTEAWSLSRADFDELAAAYPSLALALSRLLSERLRATDERFFKGAAVAAGAPTLPLRRREPEVTPVARERAAPRVPKAAAVRREPRPSLFLELKGAFSNAAAWFGSLSRGAKVRLVLLTLVLIWLLFIAAPAALISILAEDDVTNLRGAIAFVQTSTPVPTDMPVADAGAVPVRSPEAPQPAPETLGAAQRAGSALSEAPLLAAQPSLEPTVLLPTTEPPTPTPWIIVVTNTPLPVTDTPVPTETPIPPTPAPTKTRAPAAAVRSVARAPAPPTPRLQPPRDLDPRLPSLNVHIVEAAGLQPGQSYFRLIRAYWQNKEESGNDHTIYIEVIDENGSRMVGQPVEIRWPGGTQTVYVEDKPPPIYGANFPQYGTLGSYTVTIPGLPSDAIEGLGMGTPDQPAFTIHTNFLLTFQRTTW